MEILNRIDKTIKQLTPYQPGKPISEVAKEKGLDNILKLASNENQLGSSPKALAAIKNTSVESLYRYPDANGLELVAAIAHSLQLPPSQIVLGNGSNEILELSAQLFLDDKTSSVFSAHAFIVYYLATISRKSTPIIIQANDYAHDLTAMANACQQNNVGVVFIANPNNPTGTWHCANAIESCIKKIPSHVFIVLDEAYCEYLEPNERNATLPLLDKYPNLLITRTFSKIYGLAGLRIGYGIAHPEIIRLFNRIRQPFNVNALAQTAALQALTDFEHVDKSYQMNRAGLNYFTDMMTKNKIDFIPSYGNFIAFKTDGNAQEVYDSLLNNGIIARKLVEYDMPEWLRISIGTENENHRVMNCLLSNTL